MNDELVMVEEIVREMRRTCGIIFSERRKALRLSQRELAKLLGSAQSVLSRKERGDLWVTRRDELALEAVEFRAAAKLLIEGNASQWNEGLRRMHAILGRVENTEHSCSGL